MKDGIGIVVLGMHRSGTSAMAGVLDLLGAKAGRSLLPAQESVNPRGFWEHAEVVRLHDELLQALNSGWYDERPFPDDWFEMPLAREIRFELAEVLRNEFSGMPLWVLKDPRLCRLLPLWDRLFADVGIKPFYVLVVRDPVEVAASLAQRDGLVEAKSYLLWSKYVLESEQATRTHPRLVVSYDALLEDWRTALAPLVEKHGIPLALNDVDAMAHVSSFLEPALRHHSRSTSSSDSIEPLRKQAQEIYEAILGNDAKRLDQIGKEVTLEIERNMPWLNQINALLGRLTACEAKQAEYLLAVHEVSRIKGSLSWRITAPLRVIINFVKRISSR